MAPPHLDALELARINSKAVQRKVKQTASVANKLVDLANIMAGIDTNVSVSTALPSTAAPSTLPPTSPEATPVKSHREKKKSNEKGGKAQKPPPRTTRQEKRKKEFREFVEKKREKSERSEFWKGVEEANDYGERLLIKSFLQDDGNEDHFLDHYPGKGVLAGILDRESIGFVDEAVTPAPSPGKSSSKHSLAKNKQQKTPKPSLTIGSGAGIPTGDSPPERPPSLPSRPAPSPELQVASSTIPTMPPLPAPSCFRITKPPTGTTRTNLVAGSPRRRDMTRGAVDAVGVVAKMNKEVDQVVMVVADVVRQEFGKR